MQAVFDKKLLLIIDLHVLHFVAAMFDGNSGHFQELLMKRGQNTYSEKSFHISISKIVKRVKGLFQKMFAFPFLGDIWPAQ